MTEPLLRRLAARGERIYVGALPWVAPVYRAMPQVHAVIEFPFAHGGLQLRERRKLARQLTGRFSTAYVCPNSFKSSLLPFLAGIPKRVGYLGEARVGLLTHRLKNPSKGLRPPMVAFYSALSGEPGFDSDRPRLHLEPPLVEAVLRQYGQSQGDYYVFVPGAEYGPAKRWPAAHFARLAQQLEAPVLLLGSAKEAGLGKEIAALAQSAAVINLAGSTGLTEALALIAGARQVVTNDTGLMHVAAALDVPQVAIFGSSSPLHTPPLSDRAQVLWLKNEASYQPPLDCSPCYERVCPLGHLRCLNDLEASQVLPLLDKSAAGKTASP